MKRILKYKLVIALASVFVLACDYDEYNVNPNSPSSAPINTILPAMETFLAYNLYDDAGRIPGLVMQQISGAANQSVLIDQYNIQESDINTSWSNFYQSVLLQGNKILEQAETGDPETASPHYAGVVKVLQAYGIGTMTDLWGDIPYSEALQGANVLQPVYDSQESIYTAVQNLLDEAIVDLGAANSFQSPGSDDFIYGGDLDMWIRAAYSIKAKFHNNLSEVNASGSASDALAALNNGMTSNADDMMVPFGTTQGAQNPIGAFFGVQRIGDAVMGEYFVNLLNTLNDPRLPIYVASPFTGSAAGDPASAGSNLGTFYSNLAAPTFMMTYAESKFVEAEAALRSGDAARAETAYSDAIEASLTQLGVSAADIATYVAAQGTLTTGSELRDIITQKYLGSFLNSQAWTDYRRTGFPDITPAANNVTAGVIPTKLPYPQQERTYNGDNLDAASGGEPTSVTNKVWWDQ